MGLACLLQPLGATSVPRGWAEMGPAEKLLLAGVRDRYWTPFCFPCCESFCFNSSVLSPDYLASHRLENIASYRAQRWLIVLWQSHPGHARPWETPCRGAGWSQTWAPGKGQATAVGPHGPEVAPEPAKDLLIAPSIIPGSNFWGYIIDFCSL